MSESDEARDEEKVTFSNKSISKRIDDSSDDKDSSGALLSPEKFSPQIDESRYQRAANWAPLTALIRISEGKRPGRHCLLLKTVPKQITGNETFELVN